MVNLKDKKVAVVGLGPTGSILAAHLQEAGIEPAICDIDKVKLDLIRTGGIQLTGAIEKNIKFKEIFSSLKDLENFKPDIIFFAVKAHQMPFLLAEALQLDHDNLTVVSAQNGIDVENFLIESFGENKTLRMVINYAGNLKSQTVIKVTFFNPPNYIASMDDSKKEVAVWIADQLNAAGLTTKTVGSFEIIKRVWEKTILNASLSALCGIGKLTMKEAMDMADTVEIIEQIILEGIEVAEKEKIKFEDEFTRKCLRYLRKAGPHFPSLAVDLINNRATEIEFINGKIVDYGRKHYVRTPVNLSFTNMVKAISQRNQTTFMPDSRIKPPKVILSEIGIGEKIRAEQSGGYFLGIDLGSAYTKFTVIDDVGNITYQTLVQTLDRDRLALKHILGAIKSEYPVHHSCATGYGRKHFPESDIIKTEINCAAEGVAHYLPGEKCIIDIGGEDIKVIRCGENNNVDTFYMNSKCAAGTGAFLTEIAERVELDCSELSLLAAKSDFKKELNSFCTVFAKTEIMGWLFDGMPREDIARGIYISIANRVAKLRVDTSVTLCLIGGVAAHHPYLKELLSEKLSHKIKVMQKPEFVVSLGAALIARKQHGSANKKNGGVAEPANRRVVANKEKDLT